MMTVSRVMHNAESVRPATRDRVLQAIQTLNYVPDLSARKMRAQGRKPSTRRAGAGHCYHSFLC